MHLNRKTGKRVPKMKAEAEHLERQDESLRILPDDVFEKIQERTAKSARGESPRAPRGIAPFTALVFCECGAKCYLMKKQNAKGTYYYYVCGRHLRYEDCKHAGRVREDKLVQVVNGKVAKVFEHED
jgi:hypothetical protein